MPYSLNTHRAFEVVGIICFPRRLARCFADFATVRQVTEHLSADVAMIWNKKYAAVLALRLLASMHGFLPTSQYIDTSCKNKLYD